VVAAAATVSLEWLVILCVCPFVAYLPDSKLEKLMEIVVVGNGGGALRA
jgi:hypothetical protein